MNRQRTQKLLLRGTLCLLTAFLFTLLFSYSTSPLYPDYYGRDSAEFLTIGREWAAGRIPYRELFDHKGPWIFLMNGLGFRLTGSVTGVFLIQLLYLTADLAAVLKLRELLPGLNKLGPLPLIAFLLFLKLNYCQGDTVEEFCLPFLLWSAVFLVPYLLAEEKNPGRAHPPRAAFFYGLCFGICFLSRVTNFVPLIAPIFLICLRLIKQGQLRCFFQNALAALAGVLLTALPFSLYFLSRDCFGEFLNGTLLFNIRYVRHMPSWLLTADTEELCWFALAYFSFWSLFLTAGVAFSSGRRLRGLCFFLTALLEAGLFLSGADYSQYALVCCAQPLFLLEELALLSEKKTLRAGFTVILGICLLFTVGKGILSDYVLPARELHHRYSHHEEREWEPLLAQIPAEERGSFCVYGYSELQEVYLQAGLSPGCRYFILQDWQASFSLLTAEAVKSCFAEAPVLWLLTDAHTRLIDESLSAHYALAGSTESFFLYRRLEPSPE